MALAGSNLAVVYRKPGLTDGQALKIRDYAGQQLGLKYFYAGAAYSGVDRLLKHPPDLPPLPTPSYACAKVGICTSASAPKPIANDSFFCSQLVLSAYANAGVPLSSVAPADMTPGDVVDLYPGVLMHVGHLKAPPFDKRPLLPKDLYSCAKIGKCD